MWGSWSLADRHHVALAEQDVTRLVHRVGEQKARELVAAGLLLGLHRWGCAASSASDTSERNGSMSWFTAGTAEWV